MQINNTQDYTVFKRIKGNRELRKPHVNRLLEAIKQTPESITYNPILVNEKFEVIDGEHRRAAIQKLALPVYYIQVDGLTLKSVQDLNSVSKVWTPMDYARSYAELGNKNYEGYINFKSYTGFNHDVLMRYIALDLPITGTAFNAGTFRAQDFELSQELCNQLLEVGEYFDRYKIRTFALGFLKVARAKDYDHDRMIAQFKKYGNKFQEQALPNDNARELEKLYNYNRRDDVRLF